MTRSDAVDKLSFVPRNIDSGGVYIYSKVVGFKSEDCTGTVSIKDDLSVDVPVTYCYQAKEVLPTSDCSDIVGSFAVTNVIRPVCFKFDRVALISFIENEYNSKAKRKKAHITIEVVNKRTVLLTIIPKKKRTRLVQAQIELNPEKVSGEFCSSTIELETFFWVISLFFKDSMIGISASENAIYMYSRDRTHKILINTVRGEVTRD